jgi:uncharacterized protein YvpB
MQTPLIKRGLQILRGTYYFREEKYERNIVEHEKVFIDFDKAYIYNNNYSSKVCQQYWRL